MASTSRWKSKFVIFYRTIFRNGKQFLIHVQLLTFSCIWMIAFTSTIRARFCLSFVRKMTTSLGCNNLSILVCVDDILPFSRKTFCFSWKLLFLFVVTKYIAFINKIVIISFCKNIDNSSVYSFVFS